jgi:hypothetical protein
MSGLEDAHRLKRMPRCLFIDLLQRLVLIGVRPDCLARPALETDEACTGHQGQRLRIPARAPIVHHVDAIRSYAGRDVKLDLEAIEPERSATRMLEHRRPSLETQIDTDQSSLVQPACDSVVPLGWNEQRNACSPIPPASPNFLI